MRYFLAVLLVFSSCLPLRAGMMGNGMQGGMMGGNTTPAEPPPKNAAPALRQGYDLAQRFCVQCHVAPNPAQHNAAQWPQVVARMQNYMRQQKRPLPDAEQQKLILDYLSAGQGG